MFSWFSSSKPPAKDAAPSAAAGPPPPPPPPPPAPGPSAAETQLERLRRQDQLQRLQQHDREANSALSPRSLKQLGWFFAGAGFLFWSTAITRRAIARKQIASAPKLFHPSTYQRPAGGSGGGAAAAKDPEADGGMIAVQALGLATLNVFSFAIMMTGGLSWAFDISSVDELRDRARKQIMGEAAGMTDEESEREIQQWMEGVLTKFKGKETPPTPSGEAGKQPQDSQKR